MSLVPGIIFDMDGVIVNSNPAHKLAIQTFCRNHNQDVSQSFLENRLYGRTNKEWIPELFGEISTDELKKLADEKEQLFRDRFIPEENVVEGMHDFLLRMKERGVPMAVATSAPRENADYILSRLSIQEYFETVLDSSHVSTGKPDPEVYIKASKSLDREPAQCIVFEDSVSGVEAARRSGASVIGVTTTHNEMELAPCSLMINSFDGLTADKLLDLI